MDPQELDSIKIEKKLVMKNIKNIEDELKQLDSQIIEESEKLETLKINAGELELAFKKQNETQCAKTTRNTNSNKACKIKK